MQLQFRAADCIGAALMVGFAALQVLGEPSNMADDRLAVTLPFAVVGAWIVGRDSLIRGLGLSMIVAAMLSMAAQTMLLEFREQAAADWSPAGSQLPSLALHGSIQLIGLWMVQLQVPNTQLRTAVVLASTVGFLLVAAQYLALVPVTGILVVLCALIRGARSAVHRPPHHRRREP